MISKVARRMGLMLMALVMLAPARASADDTIDETLREFYRTGKWILYVSGEVQKQARVYHSRRAGAFLIMGSSYDQPLLIEPREKKVSSLPEDQVAVRPDKGLDVVAGAPKEELGTFRFDGSDVAIDVEGLVARLQPRPYLLGLHEIEEVLLHTPEYERDAEAYQPDADDVEKLKAATRKLEVVVFFGTWCPTCRRLLPRILSVDQAIAGSGVHISYYGLPKGNAMKQDAEARKNDIKRIPTGVVYVDGRRVGEISSTAWSRPERALRLALSGL